MSALVLGLKHIYSVTRASDGHSRGKTPLKNGSSYTRTNGNRNHNSKENINKLDSVPCMSTLLLLMKTLFIISSMMNIRKVVL